MMTRQQSTCVHVKSVIRDGDVQIYSQSSLKNTQELDMLYTSLLKCICIIFTNQNTHNRFYYKTLGNVTSEYAICIHYQCEMPEALNTNQPDGLTLTTVCRTATNLYESSIALSLSVGTVAVSDQRWAPRGFSFQPCCSEFCVPKIRTELCSGLQDHS